MNGYKLSNKQGLLIAGRGRKMVKSIQYPTLESIDVFLVKELLFEAVLL